MADVSKLKINDVSYDIKDATARQSIATEASERASQIAALQNAVGSPLVASTKSAMSNTSKIYVYTGTESDMTNGNWYYHNGSAWVSGGVYNSQGFETDKTLSVLNMPADAAMTGKLRDSIRKNYYEADIFASYSGTFTSKTIINTQIVLQPNVRYTIVNRTQLTGNITVFGHGEDSNYKKIDPANNVAVLTVHGTERWLEFYNLQGTLDHLEIEVYETDHLRKNDSPEVYYVNCTEPELGEYSSFTQCLLDLADNINEKIIYVAGGDYDIYQEYIDAGIPVYTGTSPMVDYYDYVAWIPKNTHIIGRGIVRFIWMPTKANNPEITVAQCKTVSPINVGGSVILENVEIHCKNGRYCIHDDFQKSGQYISAMYSDAIKKFINVKCYKYPNESDSTGTYGASSTIGFGCHKGMHYEYTNCYFGNTANGDAFYGHAENAVNGTNLYKPMSSDMVLTNCIMDTNAAESVLFSNVTNANLHCRIMFANCYFSSKISLKDAAASNPHRPNAFDLTLLNCNTVNIDIDDTNNLYPPKIYNAR